MKTRLFSIALLFSVLVGSAQSPSEFAIKVFFSEATSSEKMDGRLLLMLSTDDEKEPRFQIGDGLQNQLIFGMNVDEMGSGETKTFDETKRTETKRTQTKPNHTNL